MNCPNCTAGECWRDEVDIGVGIQYGPWRCSDCGWYEGHEADEYRQNQQACGGIPQDEDLEKR